MNIKIVYPKEEEVILSCPTTRSQIRTLMTKRLGKLVNADFAISSEALFCITIFCIPSNETKNIVSQVFVEKTPYSREKFTILFEPPPS